MPLRSFSYAILRLGWTVAALGGLCLAAAAVPAAGLATAGERGEAPPEVLAVDEVGARPDLAPAADILAVALEHDADGQPWLRVSFLSLSGDRAWLARVVGPERAAKASLAPRGSVKVQAVRAGRAPTALECPLELRDGAYRADTRLAPAAVQSAADPDAVRLRLPADLVDAATADDPVTFTVASQDGESVTAAYPAAKAYEAHCALVLHGNQGLGYSDVFAGRGDDLEGSGFDEALQVHQATGVPGNFHLAGTLQTSAEWSRNNGDPLDFNGWLASGVTAGWAGMVTSAFAQHIMPFARQEMNDWAVNTESQMIAARYGYTPRVAWVPERVWLNTSGYPSAGVSDWIGDNFQAHGVWGVILDDDVHLAGHDNHQIHFLSANGLRLIPRDRTFTGNIVGGNGQGALNILTGLAGSGVGEYRLAVFAEDWEAVAEMGSWASVTPNAKETYDWFVGKCQTESAWLHTWKLADALTNPNFNGDTFAPAPGTYNEIGGTAGYGGGDNGWYTHWAGWVPWANGGSGGVCAGAGGNCKNYGQLWNDAYNALMAAPNNNLSQAGWYVLLGNLHETAWHDGLGGPISGWQHQYSAHIRHTMVYAEAARWAAGLYTTTTAAFLSDIDNDGYEEAILHNDRLFAVFEAIGGRATHVFVKGSGYDDTAIGSDHTTWTTEGDYNDANHVGAFSDVGPNYQHDSYGFEIVSGAGPTAQLRLTRNEVAKDVSLTTGDSFLDVIYRVGSTDHWVQSGFAPSLVDLTWNAELSRIWVADQAYMGQRNPNTGIAAAWVLGAGGAGHQRNFSGTLMKGDEIRGQGTFQAYLFAGPTSAPGTGGEIAELRALATALVDDIGPGPVSALYYPTANRLRVAFDQAALPASVVPTGFAVDANGDGAADVTLGAGTTVSETGASYVLSLNLDAASAAALEALPPGNLRLLVAANSVRDVNSVGNAAVGTADDVAVTVGPATRVTIDGHVEPGEWDAANFGLHLADPTNDSAWTASNELYGLHATWDSLYLYVAIPGRVQGNSWLLYLDVDPGTANGQTDLTAIDTWERGALFTAAGFRADFEYGCYQHQSAYDGDGLWQILSPTATQSRTGEILSAFDSFHVYGDAGGSEIAIPWNTLYGLGDGVVPAGAQVSLVASICWDPEPSGVLGGDSVPSNAAASLPTLDTVWTIEVDRNGDGAPDRWDLVAVPAVPAPVLRLLGAAPNPFNPATEISFELPGPGPAPAELVIYDLRGARVTTLLRAELPPGEHRARWTGTDDAGRRVASGTYLCVLQSRGRAVTRALALVK